eukprot:2375935-Rhodomonas_salina.1
MGSRSNWFPARRSLRMLVSRRSDAGSFDNLFRETSRRTSCVRWPIDDGISGIVLPDSIATHVTSGHCTGIDLAECGAGFATSDAQFTQSREHSNRFRQLLQQVIIHVKPAEDHEAREDRGKVCDAIGRQDQPGSKTRQSWAAKSVGIGRTGVCLVRLVRRPVFCGTSVSLFLNSWTHHQLCQHWKLLSARVQGRYLELGESALAADHEREGLER